MLNRNCFCSKRSTPQTKVMILALLFKSVLCITLVSSSEESSHISACNGQPTKTIKCGSGEVIYVQSASYGSFKTGDCGLPVPIDCGANVTSYIENKCSGLERCNVTAADDYLMSNAHTYVPPCDKSFAKSLEVKFQCKKYYDSLLDECKNKPIVVSEKYGLLSGFLAKISGKGSKECPWSFIVGPSQTLLLSLWDFGVWTYEVNGDSNRCMIYAHIKSSGFITTVYPGRESKRLFYTKSDGTVNVSLQYGDSLNYLIEFEVLDCPIYNPPSFLKNIGRHGSKLLLECQEGSRKTLNISCEGGSWPQLSRIDCSLHSDISTALVHSSQVTSDSTILIVGVIALAVIISLLIIFVGLYCLNACPFQKDREATFCPNAPALHPLQMQEKYSSENLFLHPAQSLRGLYPMLANSDHRVAATQRDYATTLQMRQMAGHYTDHAGWCPAHGPYYLGSTNTIDRKCNTIKMKRNLSTPLSNCQTDLYSDKNKTSASPPSSPFYHELDQVTLKAVVEPGMPLENSGASSNGTRTPL